MFDWRHAKETAVNQTRFITTGFMPNFNPPSINMNDERCIFSAPLRMRRQAYAIHLASQYALVLAFPFPFVTVVSKVNLMLTFCVEVCLRIR